jgi:hypothetical protein
LTDFSFAFDESESRGATHILISMQLRGFSAHTIWQLSIGLISVIATDDSVAAKKWHTALGIQNPAVGGSSSRKRKEKL